jgi:hypothetical protein
MSNSDKGYEKNETRQGWNGDEADDAVETVKRQGSRWGGDKANDLEETRLMGRWRQG